MSPEVIVEHLMDGAISRTGYVGTSCDCGVDNVLSVFSPVQGVLAKGGTIERTCIACGASRGTYEVRKRPRW